VGEDQSDEARLEGGVYRVELEFTPRTPVDKRSVTTEKLVTYLPRGSRVTDVETDPGRPWLRVTTVIPSRSPAEALIEVGKALENLAIYIRQQIGRDPLDEQGWLLRAVLSPGHL
jgi:hypothetical protein